MHPMIGPITEDGETSNGCFDFEVLAIFGSAIIQNLRCPSISV